MEQILISSLKYTLNIFITFNNTYFYCLQLDIILIAAWYKGADLGMFDGKKDMEIRYF